MVTLVVRRVATAFQKLPESACHAVDEGVLTIMSDPKTEANWTPAGFVEEVTSFAKELETRTVPVKRPPVPPPEILAILFFNIMSAVILLAGGVPVHLAITLLLVEVTVAFFLQRRGRRTMAVVVEGARARLRGALDVTTSVDCGNPAAWFDALITAREGLMRALWTLDQVSDGTESPCRRARRTPSAAAMKERMLVVAGLALHVAMNEIELDDGKRGEIEQLLRPGPFDVDDYNRRWSSSLDGDLFARRLRYALLVLTKGPAFLFEDSPVEGDEMQKCDSCGRRISCGIVRYLPGVSALLTLCQACAARYTLGTVPPTNHTRELVTTFGGSGRAEQVDEHLAGRTAADGKSGTSDPSETKATQ